MHLQSIEAGAAEGWDQGRMNVDDTSLVGTDDFLRNHHQTACQNYQIRAAVLQSLQKRRVKGLCAAAFFPGNADCGNSMLLRPLQGVRLRIVADDGYDLCIPDPSCVYRVQDRLQVRAAAGYQNCDF